MSIRGVLLVGLAGLFGCGQTAGEGVTRVGRSQGPKADQVAQGAKVRSFGVIALAAGISHTCAITEAHALKCWGDNQFGTLGDGTTTSRTTPVDVIGLGSDVSAVATGRFNTCALLASGTVKCFGSNWQGALGDGTTLDRNTPVDVVGLPATITAVTTTDFHACALDAAGEVFCWGDNYWGELGDGTHVSRSVPVRVAPLPPAVAITTGDSHACAVLGGGGVKCWGSNQDGELGTGMATTSEETPVNAIGLPPGVTAISAGWGHTCALGGAGDPWCWGLEIEGALGDGMEKGLRATPFQVPGLPEPVATLVAANGSESTMALLSSGEVWAWGRNDHGQLGDGPCCSALTPAKMTQLGVVSSLTAGGVHSCAIRDGAVVCWGGNDDGDLGDGTTQDSNVPVAVTGI